MVERLEVYKCPNCGGALHYDPKQQGYACESCGSLLDIRRYRPKATTLHDFVCSECGAELVSAEETASFPCPYCGNNEVLPTFFEGEFKPDFIVPFKLGLEEAKHRYDLFTDTKDYLPKGFKERSSVVSTEGTYVPFWLFSGSIDFDFTFTASWQPDDDRGNYLIRRAGTASYKRVPADASVHMPNDMMDSLQPYRYNGLQPFTTKCMPGFVAERYTEGYEKSWERVEEQVTKGLVEMVEPSGADGENYRDISISDQEKGREQVLLPVWLFVVEYNGERYLAGVNGQTGAVALNYPIDDGKITAHVAKTGGKWAVACSLVAAFCVPLFIAAGMSKNSGNINLDVLPAVVAVAVIVGAAIGMALGMQHAAEEVRKGMRNVHEAESARRYINKKDIVYTSKFRQRSMFKSDRRLTDEDENDLESLQG